MNRKRGEFFVWISGAAVSVTLLIAIGLLIVVMVNGLGFFWPKNLRSMTLADGTRILGELIEREVIPEFGGYRVLIKQGNRDLYGGDFRWIEESAIEELSEPELAVTLERQEYGNFYGYLRGLQISNLGQSPGRGDWERLIWAMDAVAQRSAEIERLREPMDTIGRRMVQIDRRLQLLAYRNRDSQADGDESDALKRERIAALEEFERESGRLATIIAKLSENVAVFEDVNGEEKSIPIVEIVRALRPNTMNAIGKAAVYAGKLLELIVGDPRESNTEGGLFPAIFGTVLLVMLMSAFSVPMGVVAAIYLHEYARGGWLVRLVRVAMYNLAGVPSIVFGIFGLGFFVYGVGASIDQLFFAERLPAPTFGTGGILWASLTLALLTVPVVVVATEEGLSAVPRGMREASLALGSTQLQTLLRVVMPMAVPGIITGFILAMARAAGEVAPLMITGVVKLAPALPLDGEFPFLHLDRKFMHLGFHIYDVGFQSPNVEAAKPMVYLTTLLLVLIVLSLSVVGLYLRNSMRKRYQGSAF